MEFEQMKERGCMWVVRMNRGNDVHGSSKNVDYKCTQVKWKTESKPDVYMTSRLSAQCPP